MNYDSSIVINNLFVDTVCFQCQRRLENPNIQTCPYCGQMGKEIQLGIAENIETQDNSAGQGTAGITNRSVTFFDTENPTDVQKITDCVKGYVTNGNCELNNTIGSLVSNFITRLNDEGMIFYRALPGNFKGELLSRYIGPAPVPEDGRYNKKTAQCLYLTSDKQFLWKELKLSNTKLLVQKYIIPTRKYKIANLSVANNSINNSLALSFWMAESGKTLSGYDFETELELQGKSKYLISQLLSSHFKENGWDGIYFPGVHGSPKKYYNNLILFSAAATQWRQMVDSEYFEMSVNDIPED